MGSFLPSKPVEAVRWTGKNLDEVKAFLGDAYRDHERDILAVRDAKDDPTGRQRSDGLLKPTGKTKWLGVAWEFPPVWVSVDIGQWIIRVGDGFEQLTDKEFSARFKPAE